jgi:two-component system LytT family response regulator
MSSLKSLPKFPAGLPVSPGRRPPLGLVPAPLGAPIGVWVAEADPQARAALVAALERVPGVVVSGQSAGGIDVLEAIRKARPDALFLSVDLPGLSGFDVLEALEVLAAGDRPETVFLATEASQAARAFDADAADCLVRPWTAERIAVAVKRVRRRVTAAAATPVAATRRLEEWLLVKKEGRSVFVRVADIDWIESARNNVILHVGAESFVHHETTSGVEARLSPNKFLRIHRSTIVRIDRIKELVPWFNGDYRVTLKDGTQLTLSESYRDRLKRFRV